MISSSAPSAPVPSQHKSKQKSHGVREHGEQLADFQRDALDLGPAAAFNRDRDDFLSNAQFVHGTHL